MLLAIDSGNTNIVFAIYDGREIRGQWRSSNDPRRTADEYAVWLLQLMHLGGLDGKDVDSSIISNVVPAAKFSLKTLCRNYFSSEPLVIGEPDVDLGTKALVDRPAEVGADRLANTVGAHSRYGGPLVVVDFGTSTNFDVVDGDGNYCGGAIAPGINLSLEALHRAAAQLPRIEIRRPDRVIGKSTVPNMQSGVYWGYVGLIESLVTRIREEYGAEMKVIATGGLAPLMAQSVPDIDQVDPDLTLRGLMEIYRRNRPV